jgi:hypothetical protein
VLRCVSVLLWALEYVVVKLILEWANGRHNLAYLKNTIIKCYCFKIIRFWPYIIILPSNIWTFRMWSWYMLIYISSVWLCKDGDYRGRFKCKLFVYYYGTFCVEFSAVSDGVVALKTELHVCCIRKMKSLCTHNLTILYSMSLYKNIKKKKWLGNFDPRM